MLNESLYSSAKWDWSTPQELFDRLDDEFHFTLDVCAHAGNHKCELYYDPAIDGLSQEWKGIAWMNPPYGRGIDAWVKKAYEATRTPDCTCVCLLPVRSDTRWWHDYVMKAAELRLLTRRLSFEGSNNKAPFPAAIVVFNSTAEHPSLTAMKI